MRAIVTDLSTTGGRISTMLLSTALPTNFLTLRSLKPWNLLKNYIISPDTDTLWEICDICCLSISDSEYWLPPDCMAGPYLSCAKLGTF